MSAPFRLGLTGLPGAGKSTVARMFAELGVPVFNADAEVRRLYAPGGAAAAEVARLFPEVMDEQGGVDRARLRALLLREPKLFDALEAFVHPLVADARRRFVEQAGAAGAPLLVLEIPLLFEAGVEGEMDAVALADAPRAVRHQRLQQRPGFDPALLALMEERQLPEQDKRQRADFIIDTEGGLPETREQVEKLFRHLARD